MKKKTIHGTIRLVLTFIAAVIVIRSCQNPPVSAPAPAGPVPVTTTQEVRTP